MNFETLLLTVFFLMGIFFVFKSRKGWNQNYVPSKFLARIIKEAVGYNGTRFLVGLVGAILIIIPMLIFANQVLGISLPHRATSKSNIVFIAAKPDENRSLYSPGGDRYGDLQSITDHIKYSNPEIRNTYFKISFKDNYLNELPLITFELQNLEEIDLCNNDIEYLPIDKLKSLKKLRKIILTNNPVSPENLNQIKQLQHIQIIK